MFRFNGFELDPQRGELRGPDRKAIKLRPKTFEMLRLFATDAGRVISKQELMDRIWPNVHVGEDSLFQCIRELRAALGDDRREMIRLVSGRGYMFTTEILHGPAELPHPPETTSRPAKRLFGPGLRRPAAAALVGLCTVIGFGAAASIFVPDLLFQAKPPAIVVMPLIPAGHDPDSIAMAAHVTGSLTDGLARIDNIRVVTMQPVTASTAPQPAAARTAAARTEPAEFELSGELRHTAHAWELRARLTRTPTREVAWTTSISVSTDGSDLQLQQSRLTAGLGHRLAEKMNAILHAGTQSGSAKVVVEQAKAAIGQTTRERFGAAQAMLEKALADNPHNVDLEVALAAHMLRGIQMAWYSPEDNAAAESKARAMLKHAVRTRPDYLPVHEAYCRFLSATNNFVDALVACARALTFDPWNGLVLYNLGLTQIKLGRFEDALATFTLADRYDTPDVSRWTWLLGAGWASMLMGRDEDALPWLQRSIAITPATGRSHFLLAAAYQRLGRSDEAKAALAQTIALRPRSTAANIAPPQQNTSQRYRDASALIIEAGVAAGLPEQ
ncbi:tetratricopeptide repeat protein [Pseudorhodoplanes sp.]|uniref:tetratricopeptide repeat protein n=1 Tax=Pseudorhodoplanes sp. TaxID=1934341 RepID=UPI00391C0C97